MWNAPQVRAARPSSTSAARQSTSRAISAPYAVARPGTVSISGSSYWPRSAVQVHGTAPLPRIHATATEVSRPPEKAIPTRSPTGRKVSTLDTGKSMHDSAWSCMAGSGVAGCGRRPWDGRVPSDVVLPPLSDPPPPGSRTVRTDDGVDLHVEVDENDEAGLTVVLAHGFTARLAEWELQRAALRPRARLVLFDQRGH